MGRPPAKGSGAILKSTTMIQHKQIAARLAAKGIDITPEAVGLFRRGVNGSKYADDILTAEAELEAEQAERLRQNAKIRQAAARRVLQTI